MRTNLHGSLPSAKFFSGSALALCRDRFDLGVRIRIFQNDGVAREGRLSTKFGTSKFRGYYGVPQVLYSHFHEIIRYCEVFVYILNKEWHYHQHKKTDRSYD